MVEEAQQWISSTIPGWALDVANKPLGGVGGQRRGERATINSANISSRTNYTAAARSNSPFPSNGRLTDPRWRVRTEEEEEEARPAHDDRSCSAAIPSATRAFSMTCTKPSGARVSLWNTVWTNRGKFVGVIPNSWPMPDQIAFCVCLIPLRGPTLRIR